MSNQKKCNQQTITKLFNISINLLWPDVVKHKNVLWFVSDAAQYMVKVGEALNVFYLKMINLTCLTYVFKRIK